ncbi:MULTISPECIES: BON domain-containing protein [Neorhizobium]|jgi:osmotically-inducible protein OsmY|uniref:BON domain-containing protein n=1 Tax=Neorhizobium TaxID=1525371 RepID=UPI00055F409E|nr:MULTISPECIES: BON domain-containing protein [Neorhizobium]CDZ56386.1 Putative periplasmic or secreted lipoprotein [Neorhizobium galegae bv. orientalis]KAB1123993.1 BON domain-containing protein [Neorhizobium galegae]MCQ1806669.1 BON domain-containing protein [Neorhizobium galegae]MCQ1835473.1 BON domain-containing protein [Neorhizobium galegae]UIY28887.1 BON domain-containing protein [Neorhizobium galegae]
MVFKHQHFHETSPEVEAEFPPSATLEGAVSDALASAGGIDASDVAVIASGSEITLSGTVQLETEVARAEEVALSVAGVTGVRNEIRFNGIA